ncbi:MAG: hypothetical protein JWR89_1015 [Tardiphaga sp.]|nr:DUF2474 family protein [Tardiphaga sp.]MDB5501113.1 hypothetical protein [Tardiphaga sp.]
MSPAPPEKSRPLAQRLLWFAALWAGGVGTVAVIAYGLRLWIGTR